MNAKQSARSHCIKVECAMNQLECTFSHLGSIAMLGELDLALTHSSLSPIMREAVTRKRDQIQRDLNQWANRQPVNPDGLTFDGEPSYS